MDPNETLRLIRQLANRILEPCGHDDPKCQEADNCFYADHTEDAENLAGLFADLDGWLSQGGFRPKAWRDGQ